MAKPLKIGSLARQTGLTVRTLRHYEALGLLAPVARTGSGQRWYGREDLERLARVQALKALGLPLAEVRAALDAQGSSIETLVARQLHRTEIELQRTEQLRERLQRLAAGLRALPSPSTDTFIQLIEVMTMFDKYFSAAEQNQMKARAEAVGETRMREVEAAWPPLIAAVKAHMEAGTDPGSAEVQALARQWQSLLREFDGGDPEIARRAREVYEQEPEMQRFTGIDPALMRYVYGAIGKMTNVIPAP